MFARVGTVDAPGASPERGITFFRDRVVPDLRRLNGFREAILLMPKGGGEALVISLWETEEDLRAAEATAAPHRRSAAREEVGGQRRDVQVYEVAHRAPPD